MLKRSLKELHKHPTYESYGRRKRRDSAYRGLLAIVVMAGMSTAAACFSAQEPGGEQSTPTAASPTAAAVATPIATATPPAPPTPTHTPAAQYPEDPHQWQLVEIQLSPAASKPTYRIEPPCVYQGLWRDVAHSLFVSDPPTPTVKKWVTNVPWYWSPGPDFVYRDFQPYRPSGDTHFYDREGRRIEEVITPYTAVWTGDPDYPVLVYLYRDYPGAAYGAPWKNGQIKEVWPVILSEEEVMRRVSAMLYDVRGRRWVRGNTRAIYVRAYHTVPADGSWMWEMYGVRGFRRSELAKAFGMKEIFPERIHPEEWTLGKPFKVGP